MEINYLLLLVAIDCHAVPTPEWHPLEALSIVRIVQPSFDSSQAVWRAMDGKVNLMLTLTNTLKFYYSLKTSPALLRTGSFFFCWQNSPNRIRILVPSYFLNYGTDCVPFLFFQTNECFKFLCFLFYLLFLYFPFGNVRFIHSLFINISPLRLSLRLQKLQYKQLFLPSFLPTDVKEMTALHKYCCWPSRERIESRPVWTTSSINCWALRLPQYTVYSAGPSHSRSFTTKKLIINKTSSGSAAVISASTSTADVWLPQCGNKVWWSRRQGDGKGFSLPNVAIIQCIAQGMANIGPGLGQCVKTILGQLGAPRELYTWKIYLRNLKPTFKLDYLLCLIEELRTDSCIQPTYLHTYNKLRY